MTNEVDETEAHPFLNAPHRTLVALSVPVLFSLVAEPITALVDTAFVAQLGATSLAALGVGTIALSSTFWAFGFLGIGTQTEVARAVGAGDGARARQVFGLAVSLAALCGIVVAVLGEFLTPWIAATLGAKGETLDQTSTYLRIRWLASPAVLVTVASFGILRGLQDMKSPLALAIGLNAVNLALDPLLIFGAGPVPAFGIAGAAWATVVAQTLGGGAAVWVCLRKLGKPARFHLRDLGNLLVVGRDLFARTALLTLFLLLGTRVATGIGPEAGAAHHAIRSFWLFTAFLLDAYAMTAQSLVGNFLGATRVDLARRVAKIACLWSLGTGLALVAAMGLGEAWVRAALVPPESQDLFGPAWWMSASFQPLNALCFATDGILWGASDFRYLRNAMLAATALAATALLAIDELGTASLLSVWAVTAAWIAVRTVMGMLRIWPGIGRSPLTTR